MPLDLKAASVPSDLSSYFRSIRRLIGCAVPKWSCAVQCSAQPNSPFGVVAAEPELPSFFILSFLPPHFFHSIKYRCTQLYYRPLSTLIAPEADGSKHLRLRRGFFIESLEHEIHSAPTSLLALVAGCRVSSSRRREEPRFISRSKRQLH